ncbi:hypothetical protein JHK87_050543 [Glycine soja]|nr:hypothetical protein JHK87_050543 [Glycine soja]
MTTPQKSTVKFAILLLFIIFASDVYLKLEARKDIVTLRCLIDENCYNICPDCGCKCINTWCKCFPTQGDLLSFTNNNYTQAP